MNRNQYEQDMSAIFAALLVSLSASEMWCRKLEEYGRKGGLVLNHENKRAVNGIFQACKAIKFHMEHMTDFGLNVADTDDKCIAFDAMQAAARDVAKLSGLYINSDDTYTVLESYMKLHTKEPLLRYEVINEL